MREVLEELWTMPAAKFMQAIYYVVLIAVGATALFYLLVIRRG